MGFISDEFYRASMNNDYRCPNCGARMEYEDEDEDTLVCDSCGYSMDVDDYGTDPDEDLYPIMEDDEDEDDEDDSSEYYDPEIDGMYDED